MRKLVREVSIAALSDIPILLIGETGTGKEVISKLVHQKSSRRSQKFLGINCAAIPDSLAEAEFFGALRGSYTGSATTRNGYFQECDGGTLLLDELAEMPLALQAKLLRVLEDGYVRSIGSVRDQKVNVRIIAALNKEPQHYLDAKQLRLDLYHRIGVVCFDLPPLRERREDIVPLAQSFLSGIHASRRPRLTWGACRWLEQQEWPGNIRELRNQIIKSATFYPKAMLKPEHFSMEVPVHEKPGA